MLSEEAEVFGIHPSDLRDGCVDNEGAFQAMVWRQNTMTSALLRARQRGLSNGETGLPGLLGKLKRLGILAIA